MNEHQNFPNLVSPHANDAFAVPAEDPLTRAEVRQDERMAEVPGLYRTTHERLAVELAMKMEDPETIFQNYGYSPDEALALMESPAFTALLTRIGAEIRENGLSFKAKCKAIAEDLLPYAHEMATDPHAAASVRADLIKWAAKMAGYEPPPVKAGEGDGRTGGGLNLHITFAGQVPQQVVAARETQLIDQEGV